MSFSKCGCIIVCSPSPQAFGTMGLLFPLVIPTVCQLAPCQEGPALQATASILASSIFGNGEYYFG